MGRTLIVAEKPSQAREYAAALGVRKKRDGYLENDRYVITWCYGHLLELARPESYMDLARVGKRWSLKRLPVLPPLKAFRRVVKTGSREQYRVILTWLQSPDIEGVICGTDADREGQLLFEEVWEASKCTKPLSRLWISSLTAAAIREGMGELRPAEAMAGLAAAGRGRAFADWDFGMNFTEGFTALFGSFDALRKKPNVISIGRVQTPTLALIVEREWEIEGFVAQIYYEVQAKFETPRGMYAGKWFDPAEETKRITSSQDAEAIVEKTKSKAGIVRKIEQNDIREPAPLLFDLTSLTVTASKKYGFGAEKTLQVAQTLYEKKAITYPRTDCAYLGRDLASKLPEHLEAVRREPYVEMADEAGQFGVPNNKRVFNTITAHHGIIPTTEKISTGRLSREEEMLYDLIVRRFLAVWFPPSRYRQTEVVTEVAGESFRTKGRVLLSPGWKKVYGTTEIEAEEETLLPPLKEGEEVRTKRVFSEEKTTKPPKRYSQGDLIKAMEGAGKQIEDEVLRQQMKGKGLGTVATRPAIIENLLDRGYIRQEQKTLRPTEKGRQLISLIKERLPQAGLLISAEMTGQMEYKLSQVEKGELRLEQYMADVEKAVVQIIEELCSFEQKCGKSPLALTPLQKKGRSAGKAAAKKTGSKPEEREKEEKQENEEKRETEESEEKQKAAVLGRCPKCGGEVIEGKKGFGCSRWREGCRFVLWKTPICGKVLTPHQVKSLLKKGKTPLIKGFKGKSGRKFSAYLVWENQTSELKFEFDGK